MQCEQVKGRPREKMKVKVSYSVVSVGKGGGGSRHRILDAWKVETILSFRCLNALLS